MWTDRPFIEAHVMVHRLIGQDNIYRLKKVTKLVISLARFARCMNGRLLAADFKLITQSRLNPFSEWTAICTHGLQSREMGAYEVRSASLA